MNSRRCVIGLSALVLTASISACGSNRTEEATSPAKDSPPSETTAAAAAAGTCPTTPVDVVVSVDQW